MWHRAVAGLLALVSLASGSPWSAGTEPFNQAGQNSQQSEMRSLVARYLAAYNAMKLDDLMATYADEILFEDRTLGLKKNGQAELREVYQGAMQIPARHEWQVSESFYTGEFAVLVGNYRSEWDGKFAGQPGVTARGSSPFITVLQLRNGKILRQWDFLAYDEWDSANPLITVPIVRRAEPKAVLGRITRVYKHLLGQSPPDANLAMSLYADDMVFEDPTWGVITPGKENFRRGYEQVMRANAPLQGRTDLRRICLSGSFVLMTGLYSQKRKAESAPEDRVSAKFATILEVREGKIIRHTDFFDMQALGQTP